MEKIVTLIFVYFCNYCLLCIAQTPITIYTPKGSTVPDTYILSEYSTAQIAAINNSALINYPNATIISNASATYNCHGYALYVSEGGANVWIGYSTTTAEDIYWTDGSYWEICAQSNPCKVSYSSDNHTAITTSTNDIFKSKWGTYPLMQHEKNYTPYNSNNLKYYVKPFTINGNNSICLSSPINYDAIGVPSGYNVTWSLSPSGIATITPNGNSCSVARNGSSNGQVTLTATLSLCGINHPITKNINVGNPYVLFPSNPPQYPGALIYDYDNDENCNYTCYHPSIYRNYSISDPYNGTVTWQKVSSYPANVAWNTSNNTISVLLKAVNQTITLKRTITNPCNTANPLVEYYCFRASGSLCSSLRSSTPPIAQQLKVYPNPTSINNALTLELTSDKGEVIDFENSSIQLVDAQNVVIVQKSGNKIAKEKLEIPALSKGVYYIKVTNKNGVSTQQLMVNN
jgi:hypothetical protein